MTCIVLYNASLGIFTCLGPKFTHVPCLGRLSFCCTRFDDEMSVSVHFASECLGSLLEHSESN